MKAEFRLLFDERDDGTKVWSAKCQGCGTALVGELYPPVTVVSLRPDSAPLFEPVDSVRFMIKKAWETARAAGTPIFIPDDRFVVSTVPDSGDLQRALEAHQGCCPASKLAG